MEQILFKHNRPDRAVTFREYCSEGGYDALRTALAGMSPAEVQQTVIDSPPGGNADGKLDPGENGNLVVVLKNAGPQGGPGMPEWGQLPIPKKLLQAGVQVRAVTPQRPSLEALFMAAAAAEAERERREA